MSKVRLIDANALLAQIKGRCENCKEGKSYCEHCCDYSDIIDEIEEFPTYENPAFLTITFNKDQIDEIVAELVERIKNGEFTTDGVYLEGDDLTGTNEL